jgi:hypothetical protein
MTNTPDIPKYFPIEKNKLTEHKKDNDINKQTNKCCIVNQDAHNFRGFNVFYNRRYFLNFRRYLKN